MAKTWKELQNEIEAWTQKYWLIEPPEMSEIHQGKLENRAGSYGQFFETVDNAVGMLRDFQNFGYKLLVSFMNPAFNLEQCKVVIRNTHPGYIDYLRYSNFLTWYKFDCELQELLDTFETKEDLIEFYKTYIMFVNNMSAWAYHYFPHELGALFMYERK